jgi:hypothetical protein
VNHSAALTTNEQITLRRVAHGLSEVDFVRRRDLDHLRTLELIDSNKRVPQLTAEGKRRYDALPLALAVMHCASRPRQPARLGGMLERRPRR